MNKKQWIEQTRALVGRGDQNYKKLLRRDKPSLACSRSFSQIDLNGMGNDAHLTGPEITELKRYNRTVEQQCRALIRAIDDKVTWDGDIRPGRKAYDDHAIHEYFYEFRNVAKTAPRASKALIKLTKASLKHHGQGVDSLKYPHLTRISTMHLESAKYYDVHNLLVQKAHQIKALRHGPGGSFNPLVIDAKTSAFPTDYQASRNVLNGFNALRHGHNASKAVIKILNGLRVLWGVNVDKSLKNLGINTADRPERKRSIHREIIAEHTDQDWYDLLLKVTRISLPALKQVCKMHERK